MNAGILGAFVGLLVAVAALVLIFATGGLGLPIGIVMLIGLLAAGVVRTRSRSTEDRPGSDPRRARPGQPLTSDDDTVFVGTGERSDPLAR